VGGTVLRPSFAVTAELHGHRNRSSVDQRLTLSRLTFKVAFNGYEAGS
jgi:hypothetical protein